MKRFVRTNQQILHKAAVSCLSLTYLALHHAVTQAKYKHQQMPSLYMCRNVDEHKYKPMDTARVFIYTCKPLGNACYISVFIITISADIDQLDRLQVNA